MASSSDARAAGGVMGAVSNTNSHRDRVQDIWLPEEADAVPIARTQSDEDKGPDRADLQPRVSWKGICICVFLASLGALLWPGRRLRTAAFSCGRFISWMLRMSIGRSHLPLRRLHLRQRLQCSRSSSCWCNGADIHVRKRAKRRGGNWAWIQVRELNVYVGYVSIQIYILTDIHTCNHT